jgi:16S rRNA (guanine527-N7)-methyltransferase
MPRPPEQNPLGPEEVRSILGVSRETLKRLDALLEAVRRWQPRINLVGPNTLSDPWRRHILDSAQLWALWPSGARRLVDLGSGAGFPGLVLAILGAPEVHLVESDKRKAAFLREAARVINIEMTIHAVRAEALAPLQADVLTARALAPLPELLKLAAPFLGPHTTLLLPKGRQAQSELTAARAYWTMDVDVQPSLADREGRILILRNIRRG